MWKLYKKLRVKGLGSLHVSSQSTEYPFMRYKRV